MYEKCFYFLFKFIFLRKNGISEKNWNSFPLAHWKKTSPMHFNNCSAPPFNSIQKIFSPTPHLKEWGRDYGLYMKDYKGANKITTILIDRYFIYRTEKS